MARLEVQIGADVKEALNKLKQTEDAFEKAGNEASKTGSKIQNLSNKSMPALNKNTGQANSTLIAFTGIIQDAPFGIRGVANNIEFLTQSFVHLKAQQGGTRAAFKSLLASLTGPAGILVAISLVTSGLQFFSIAQQKAKRETKGASEAIDDYVENLDELKRAQLEGVQNAQKELFSLQQLRRQAEDINIPMNERVEAVNELKRIYPDYLKNMSDEQILGGKVAAAYEKITQNILAKAQAQALENEIVQIYQKQLVLQSKLSAKTAELAAEQNSLNKLQQLNAKNISGGVSFGLVKQEQAVSSLKDEVNSLTGQLQGSQLAAIDLEQEFRKLLKTSKLNFADIFGGGGGDAKEFFLKENRDLFLAEAFKIGEEAQQKLNEGFKKGATGADLANIFDKPLKRSGNQLKAFNNSFKPIEDSISRIKTLMGDAFNEDIEFKLRGLNLEQLKAFESQIESLQTVSNIATSAMASGFRALAGEISQSLETGNAIVDAFVSSIVNSLTDLLAQFVINQIAMAILGKAEIGSNQAKAQGAGIVVATNAAAALGPAGIIALPGLIGTVTAGIAAAFAPLYASFAKGGFSGDDNLAFLNRNELILRPMEQAALYNAIRGHDLGRLDNSVGARSLVGGDIVATYVVRGRDQLVTLRRAERFNNRFDR